MSKMSFSNEDQCPAQCDEKYRKTQNVVGLHKRLINMIGSLINQTDDVIQGLSNTEFDDDLTKYKDISSLARKMSTVFASLPWVNREIGKMVIKMIEMDLKEDYYDDDDDDDDDDYDEPKRRPPTFGPRPNPLRYSLSDERMLIIEINGPIYIEA